MIRFFSFFFLLFCLYTNVFAKQKPTAYCYFNSFFSPQGQPYLETYVSFIGSTFTLQKQQNKTYCSKVELEISILQNNLSVAGGKYLITGPSNADSTKPQNFIDIKRFELNNGSYRIQFKIKDVLDSLAKIITASDTFTINFSNNKINFSGIELVESYTPSTNHNLLTKSGYELIPYVSNFYPENFNQLTFYAEIYNTDKQCVNDEVLVVRSSLQSYQTGAQILPFASFFKTTPKPVVVVLNSLNIKELASGNYYLVIELINKNQQVLAQQKLFFQRFNPLQSDNVQDLSTINLEKTFVEEITNPDSLREYIRSLRPIANQLEENFITKEVNKASLETMQRFFLSFWSTRNSVNPEQAWHNYKRKLEIVDAMFKTSIKKGYATDRGRVYLKYGEPNQMSRFDNEPSSYPYEIWQYYTMEQKNNRNNRKFIFYNPDLVTNDYILIHSDAIGETRDDRWQVRLQKRNNAINNFDVEKGNDHFGSKVQDIYSNPR
jgi:GWxTD domain-containing protein